MNVFQTADPVISAGELLIPSKSKNEGSSCSRECVGKGRFPKNVAAFMQIAGGELSEISNKVHNDVVKINDSCAHHSSRPNHTGQRPGFLKAF